MTKKNKKNKKKDTAQFSIDKKRIMIAVIPIAFILIVLYFTANARTDPYFNIRNIDVAGNSYLTKSEIIAASKLKCGDNIHLFSGTQIMKNIKQLNRIKKVSVVKDYPHTVNIKIEEFKQIALVNINGNLFEVTENGYTYPGKKGITYLDMPVVSGLNLSRFGTDLVSPETLRVIKGLAQVNSIYYLTSELNFANKHDIKLYLRNNKIALINKESAQVDIKRLELLLRSTDLEQDDRIIDLRFRKRAYIRTDI